MLWFRKRKLTRQARNIHVVTLTAARPGCASTLLEAVGRFARNRWFIRPLTIWHRPCNSYNSVINCMSRLTRARPINTRVRLPP